jgi:RNA polymerase sigma-70 factor (ECF subfamily)
MNPETPSCVKDDDMARESEELSWVRAAQGGDTEAYRPLYDRYFPKLYQLVLGMARDTALAEEIAQDALFKGWQRLHSFRGNSRFGTWLHRIAINSCLDRLRRDKVRKAESLEALTEEGTELAEPHHAPTTSETDRAHLADRIQSALQRLPEDHRAVFVMGEIQGLPYDEISRILDCPRGTVMSRMHYARMKLQKLLQSVHDAER